MYGDSNESIIAILAAKSKKYLSEVPKNGSSLSKFWKDLDIEVHISTSMHKEITLRCVAATGS